MTLVRNNLCASETKRYMEEAEYIHLKVTFKDNAIDLVNYYCPNDKMLALNTIQVSANNFMVIGDFNSQSQSWGYNTLDKRGEELEDWQDENSLLLVNDPKDTPTFYSRRWHTTTTPDLAFCTEDIHKDTVRTVGPQLGGSDHRPILLSISGKETMTTPLHPRWNYRKADWRIFKIRSNELLHNLEVTGRNINNVIKDFNASIIKAAKECIPRGARKNYIPYWSSDLQKAHDNLTKATEEAEQKPSLKNNNTLQQCKAQYQKKNIECKRKSWRQKTAGLLYGERHYQTVETDQSFK